MEYFQCDIGSFTEAKSTQVHHWLSVLYWKNIVWICLVQEGAMTRPHVAS